MSDVCPLTPTQLTVLALIRAGAAAKTIANRLGITRATVRVHLFDARHRLGTTTTEQAVDICHTAGWLPAPPADVSDDDPLPPALALYVEAFVASRFPHEPTDAQRAVMAAALAAHRSEQSQP